MIDVSGIEKLEKHLEFLSSKSLPYANRFALNEIGDKIAEESKKNMKKDFVVRTPFTLSSMRVVKARGNSIDSQEVIVGSVSHYMKKQEFGGIKTAGSEEGVPIPTSFSAGQSQSKVPRTRRVLPVYRKNSVVLADTGSARKSNKDSELIFKAKKALKSPTKLVFINMHSRKGIFKVDGSLNGDTISNMRVTMVKDMSQKTMIIKPRPWFSPAVRMVKSTAHRIYQKHLLKQIKMQQQRLV